jgi:hypothetical protein
VGRVWKVVQMSGLNVVLESRRQRIDVPRPKDPTAHDMFMTLRADMTVDDGFLEVILKPKPLP